MVVYGGLPIVAAVVRSLAITEGGLHVLSCILF
jgi:hypothetical protein